VPKYEKQLTFLPSTPSLSSQTIKGHFLISVL